MPRYRSYGQPRFYDYREITAKFDSTGTCGHDIKQGQVIGYCRRNRKSYTQCAACWQKWVAENQEADAIESGYINNCW